MVLISQDQCNKVFWPRAGCNFRGGNTDGHSIQPSSFSWSSLTHYNLNTIFKKTFEATLPNDKNYIMLGTFGLAITQPSRLRSKVALIFSLVPALVNWTEFLCTHKILPLTHWHSPLLVQLPQFCHELQRLDVCHWVNWIESRYTSYSFRLRKKRYFLHHLFSAELSIISGDSSETSLVGKRLESLSTVIVNTYLHDQPATRYPKTNCLENQRKFI